MFCSACSFVKFVKRGLEDAARLDSAERTELTPAP